MNKYTLTAAIVFTYATVVFLALQPQVQAAVNILAR